MNLDKEVKNLIQISVTKFDYTISTFKFIFNYGFFFILNKINKNKYKNYPIRSFSILALNEYYSNQYFIETNEDQTLNDTFYYKTPLFSIKANANFLWRSIFNSKIEDSEVICSLSRLYWLIYDYPTLKKTSHTKSIQLIKHWIISIPYEKSNIPWEPYNVSERISSITNSLILQDSYKGFILVIQNDIDISNYLKLSLSHLITNLEYYPKGISYNHVVNNLKGILTIAILLNDEKLINTTSNLFFKELDILLLDNGFIREGSSHYQFIVTRWVIELEWLCKLAGQNNLKTQLQQCNIKLLKSCFFYFVLDFEENNLKIPLIGDVSPDFDPEWIIDYFKCICKNYNKKNTKSYGHLILEELGYDNYFENKKRDNSQSCSLITRFDCYEWVLFIRHQAHNGEFFPNHAHDDFSSFNLYFKGKEIIGDPGRVNYTMLPNALGYIAHSSHNVISLAGLPIQATEWKRHLQPAKYKLNECIKTLKNEYDEIEFSIQADSFKRVSGINVTNYKRNFKLSKHQLTIEDHITGSGACLFSNQLILNPEIMTNLSAPNRILLQNDLFKIELTTNQDEWEIRKSGFYSEKYMFETKTTKLVYNKMEAIPTLHKIQFNIN